MNLRYTDKRQDGSALLVAMGITLVLSLALASYLTLTLNERSLATRSADWNLAIPLAEAGVEEALTHLYYYGTNNLATNGYWTLGGDGMYHKSRTQASGTFYTAIQLGTYPTIWSTGRVTAPFGGTNAYVKRLVKVTTYQAPVFGQGITTKGSITLKGGAYVDSFNSANGPYSAATASSNAVALTDSTASGAITLVGTTVVKGTAVTGPGGTVSGSSSVTGGTSANANVQINDITAPTFSTYSITMSNNVTVSGTNYDYGVGTGNYQLGSISLNNKSLVISGNAVIYCTGITVTGGGGSIYIAPGGSLKIYSAGDISIAGQGLINGAQTASKCLIYGLPTCANISYTGGSDFIGVVDAPEADFKVSGNAAAFGAFVANSATINGSGGVHYDMGLTSGQAFAVQSWNELPAP